MAALQWVRNYLLFEGTIPNAGLAAEFENLYTPRERTFIFAIFKLMLFFNMLVNTVSGDRYTEGTSCEITPGPADKRTPGESLPD